MSRRTESVLPDDAAGGGEAEGHRTRVRLVRAATEVIQKGGWSSASVGAIAMRAGVAAGTLYRHFPSKAELFVEVFRAVSQREVGAMYEASAHAGSFPERFEAVVATYAGRALRNRRLAWALVYEPVDPLVDAERLAYRRDYRENMARLLREGIEAGAIPPQDAALAAAAVVGVIAEALVGPLSPVADVTASEAHLVAAIVSLCRRVVGLSARSATTPRPDAGGPSARRSHANPARVLGARSRRRPRRRPAQRPFTRCAATLRRRCRWRFQTALFAQVDRTSQVGRSRICAF